MKLACSSTAFDQHLRNGELTQLEWIEMCARELAADGVVFDMRHFPRTDTDYLAQLKKMCADLGLTVAALRSDGFFAADSEHMEQGVEIALALGSPLLASRLQPETASSWSEQLERLNTATSIAKRLNVTLAVQNVPHSFASSSHDMKRVAKEADSAWLRYALDVAAFEAADEPQSLLQKTVLVWQDVTCLEDAARRLRELLSEYRGFVALDAPAGDASPSDMQSALSRCRTWLC